MNRQHTTHTPDTIAAALSFVPSDDRDTWIEMAMAVKSELGDAGFDVWNDWSQSAENYKEKDAKSVWKSIKEGGRITIGTLLYEAKQRGFKLNGQAKTISAAEWERIRQERDERQRLDAEKKAKEEEAASRLAEEIYNAAAPAALPSHPYLVKKGISPCHGLRAGGWYQVGADGKRFRQKENCLLVPMRDADGKLWNLQAIFPERDPELERDKDYLLSGRKQGTYFSVGKPDGAVVIGEGLATMLSIRAATGLAVCVAFDKGNLLPVGKCLRGKLPDVRLIFAADNDIKEGKPNYGVEKSTAAAADVGGFVAIPELDGRKSDFNDLSQERGQEAVKAAIEEAQPVAPKEQEKETSMQVVNLKREPEPKKKIIVVSIEDFLARELPPREVLLSPWLLSQSLNMVYAWRGVGKTHFSMNVAYALASGGQFMQWKAEKPRKVLYIDGEMPGGSLQKRLAEMVKANDKAPDPGFLNIITPDMQPDFMPIPDLATFEGQDEIDEVIESTQAEVIFLDNLSCLVRGQGKENESEGWLLVQGWALKWRAKGRSIVFIHHEGKSGAQRGTSRREDVLDTSIRLKQPPDYSPTDGACFEVHFEKARNLHGDQLAPIEARLAEDQHGKQVWTIKSLTDATYKRVVELANVGLRQAEIAIELQVNRSTVSRHYRKAKDAGEIKEAKE